MRWMLKNSDGDSDAMLTLLVITSVVVLVKFLVAGISVALGNGKTWDLGAADAGVIAALLAPPYAAYTARRNNDKRAAAEVTKAQIAAAAPCPPGSSER